MKSIRAFILLLVSIPAFTSCLKDTNLLDPSINETPNVIELQNYGILKSSVTSTYPLYFAYPDLVDQTDLNLTVSYSGAYVAPEDIVVTLAMKPEVLTKYNTENKASYVQMPDSLYTIPATTVTIPKGSRKATFTIKVKSTKFDLAKTFALPIGITSASSGTVSGNFSNAVYYVAPRNKYDGTYTLKGESVHETTASLSGALAAKDFPMVTSNPNSVYLNGVHSVPSGTALASTYVPVYTINNDNTVTVTSRNPATIKFENAPNYNSRFDPATKTIYAKWRYPLSASAYRNFTDTLTFKALRS